MGNTLEAGAPALKPGASIRIWQSLLIGAGVGLVGGALTMLGQQVLAGSGGWFMLVNSATPWVVLAFVVGMSIPGRHGLAAGAGALTEAGMVLGYYGTAFLSGFAVSASSTLIWILAGVLAGPVYAAAGSARRHPRILLRVAGLGLLGGVLIMEGCWALWLATDANSNSGPGPVAGWCAIAIGVVLPLVLGRSIKDRIVGLLMTIPVMGLVLVGYLGVMWLFMQW
ncbi:DUF6518 family protein [Saccharopolyspora sp. K220]|uniref:DUF6518 family protein n=1 Tax=Saccharopolyspora soli TaxID=2926618 RepID=UPI001F57D46E|nr:DUF6518 family protein [Saccharopolyspora soli]MCI2420816.1 DUF6518 family protein [Saccharopolyspora soli]